MVKGHAAAVGAAEIGSGCADVQGGGAQVVSLTGAQDVACGIGHQDHGLLGAALRAQGVDVRGTDRLDSPWVDAVGDLRDAAFVRDAVAGCRQVIRRIAQSGRSSFYCAQCQR